jgi:hypothetical protein
MAVRRKKARKRGPVNAKKKVVDGITFASGLEATMYILLRDSGIDFNYEEPTYTIFEEEEYPEACFERARRTSPKMIDRRKVNKITYTPDFVHPNEEWVIECKGRANERFPMVWKMFKSMLSKRKNSPLLFKPANKADCEQVIEELLKRGYGRK